MTSYLQGVVRRGAGVAMPVTVRPSRGPEHVPTAQPGFTEAPPETKTDDVVLHGNPVAPAMNGPITQSQAGPEPRHEAASFAPAVIAARPVETELHGPMTPRVEISKPEVRATLRERTAQEPAAVLEPLRAERDLAIATAPIMPVKEITAPRESAPFSQARPVSPSTDESPAAVERKLSPKLERQISPQPQARAKTSRASASGVTSVKATAPDKTINVKIGRVEIRSAQPAPVAPRPRANSTRGFDDARLSRLYLDRNMR